MATEKYLSELTDFQNEFGISFNIDAYVTLRHKMKSTGIFIYDRNDPKERLETYTNTLYAALMDYVKSKVGMGDGQHYDVFKPLASSAAHDDEVEEGENELDAEANALGDVGIPHEADLDDEEVAEEESPIIDIAGFILAFERVMREKFASDVEEGEETISERKPFEGAKFGVIARDMLRRVSQTYDKSLSDLWAKDVLAKRSVMKELKILTGKATSSIDTTVKTEHQGRMDFITRDREVKTLITAKKAMEKVRAQRGYLWAILPWNWSRNSEEKAYLESLKNKLTEYESQGLTADVIAEIMHQDDSSVLSGNSESIERASERLANPKPPVEEVKEEKVVLDVTEITDLTSAKYLFADKKFAASVANEAFNAIDMSKVNSPLVKHDVMKRNWIDLYYKGFSAALVSMWEKFEKATTPAEKEKALSDGARKVFTEVNNNLVLLQLSSNKDRLVTAQQIADMLLKKYSPVITDAKYAEYADRHGLNKINPDDYIDPKTTRGTKYYNRLYADHAGVFNEAREAIGLPKMSEESPFKIDEVANNVNVEQNDNVINQNEENKVEEHDVNNNVVPIEELPNEEEVPEEELIVEENKSKEEAQRKDSNPLRESIEIHELSEKVVVNNATAQVKEPEAPNKSNVKQ